MFVSYDSAPTVDAAKPFSTVSESSERRFVGWRRFLRARWLMTGWAVLSLMWIAAVGYDLCQRVSMQADMSRDIEAELDQGFITASCTGPQCGGTNASTSRIQNWSGIASTYIKFGSDEMAECIFGPPAALLVIGLSTAFVVRRRPAKLQRS